MTIFLRNVSVFFLANVTARGLGALKTFWLVILLSPGDYGIWIFLLMLTSYAPILTLGTMETLLKKGPFFRGKGDFVSAREIDQGVFSFTLIVTLFFFFAGFGSRFFLSRGPSQRFGLPVQFMLFSLALSLLSAFYYYRLQSYQRFDLASAITTARSILVLACQIPLTYLMGLTGVFVGFLLCEVLVLVCSVLLNIKLPRIIKLQFKLSLYGNLIKTGLPITIVWWTYMIQTSVDRIVSMWMLGESATGYYGIGMSIALAFLMLPDAVNQVLYPSINKEYGRSTNPRNLAPLVVDPGRIMSMLLPFLAWISVILLPFIFTLVVPKYKPGLVAAQLLIVAALYSGITRGGTNLLISIDKQWLLLTYIAGCLVINVCANIFLVKLGLGINGIAISTCLSSALLTISIWLSVFGALGLGMKDRIKSTLELFAPGSFFTLLTIINQYFLRSISPLSVGFFVTIGIEFVLYWGILFTIPHYRKIVVKSIMPMAISFVKKLRGVGGLSDTKSNAGGETRAIFR